MDIYDVSEAFRISVRKLRAMEKANVLRLEPENEQLSKARYYAAKGRTIPALDLLYLVENPAAVLELGDKAGEAQRQIDALGDLIPAPAKVANAIDIAAKDDPAAVNALCDWLQSVLPTSGRVPYSWVAVRILLALQPSARSYIASRLPKALLNVRALPRFEGWSNVITIKGRRVTFYEAQKAFDL